MTATARASFQWDDPLLLDQQLSDDERMVRDSAAAYSQDRLAPRQRYGNGPAAREGLTLDQGQQEPAERLASLPRRPAKPQRIQRARRA